MQTMTSPLDRMAAAWLVLMLALVGCGSPKAADASRASPAKEYAMHGEIMKLDADGHVATIKHENIPGFMNAMTMGYQVKDAAEFSKLKVGDPINATVYVKDDDMWVGNIQKAAK
jgi:Cu/Ag efflux protein CusF